MFQTFFDCWYSFHLKASGKFFPGPSIVEAFKEATVMSKAGYEAAFPAEIGCGSYLKMKMSQEVHSQNLELSPLSPFF